MGAGMRKLNQTLIASLFLSLAAAGCGGMDSGELIEDPAVDTDAEGKADQGAIALTTVTDDIGSTGTKETRKVFTTAAAYKAYFGHAAPDTVRFSKEWVAFYSAGVERTGGYKASIERVALSNTGLTLKVTTSLSSPGPDCIVTQSLTKPYVLVKFKKPVPPPVYVKFYRDDVTRSCGPTGPFCGGIAGIPCPGMGRCGDNPNDNCDPAAGGADCGGICSCIDTVLCVMGYHFNSDPTVCACVPDTTTTGEPCGTNVCGAGEYCCNASCGICAPTGGFCTQQFCMPI
jgi:PrcB C-terminal